MNLFSCILPGGYWDEEGILHREVELAPLTGREEELLASQSSTGSAGLVTSVLARCIRRLGSIAPVQESVARGLLVADRLYLLLKLRALTFGGRVQSSVHCPWPDCGKKVDLNFNIDDIPVRESIDKGPVYTIEISEEALERSSDIKRKHVTFRLPTGVDQEAIGGLVLKNEALALTRLLERCVAGSGDGYGSEFIAGLSPLAKMEIEKAMENAAPAVDTIMEAHCPECGRDFSIPLDIQDFFFGELRTSRDLLYREVHYLSYHYHWSEREIMDMTREKRRGYIDILADELERANNG